MTDPWTMNKLLCSTTVRVLIEPYSFFMMILRQYRIIQVCGLRSKIFRQVVQINQGKADALPRFFGQADGIIFKQAVRLELCGVALI